MSKDWYQDIMDFHEQVMGDDFPKTPHHPGVETVNLRRRLIKEEVGETIDALNNADIVALADGIVDSMVVLLGTAITFGIDIRPIWDEIHKTNMAKIGGKVRKDGKKLKPDGWVPPKVAELLEKQREPALPTDSPQ